MKKSILATAIVSSMAVTSVANASDMDMTGLGLGVNYGLFSGPTLELTYPLNDTFQVRGALSGGMGISETESGDTDEEIDYAVEADGGVHRLAVDYHPFDGTFFLSAGYAINNFSLDTTGSGSVNETVEIGDDEYQVTADLALKGALDWESGPTLSLGWGHSPSEGWGAMLEIGAIFTGAPDVSLSGSGFVRDTETNQVLDVSESEQVKESLAAEEQKLEDDIADFTILPILQAGITYRF